MLNIDLEAIHQEALNAPMRGPYALRDDRVTDMAGETILQYDSVDCWAEQEMLPYFSKVDPDTVLVLVALAKRGAQQLEAEDRVHFVLPTSAPSPSFRGEVMNARALWLEENGPKDGTDCVTPFDQFLYAPLRDREADRARFPDPAFNRWLDEAITENGEHTVWDQVVDVAAAWGGWENRAFYAPATQEDVAKDAARWGFILDAADDMKTSRYVTFCSLLNIAVDEDFDLAAQVDIALATRAKAGAS